jgi:Kef-type K+ transport system membrane component KefB
MTPFAVGGHDTLLATLLLDLAMIAGCALALGALARRVGQAAVVGEIVAGLILGPSLLGLLPGQLDEVLFPQEVRPYLQMFASVALVLFMFGIGFEVDIERMRRRSRDAVRIVSSSVLFPLIAAVLIAPLLWVAHPPADDAVTQIQFALFVAIVLSVTAFPVLARVLADAELIDTPLGSLTLLVAAITDLVAWIALAALTATLSGSATGLPTTAVVLLLAGFLALLILVVRPVLRHALASAWCKRHGPAGGSLLLLSALALCAAATTQLGLHPAFGAFALGVACPRRGLPKPTLNGIAAARDPRVTESARCERTTAAASTLSAAGLLLVPLYFITTGLSVDVTSLGLQEALEVCALLVVATVTKVAGVAWAAARSGLDRGHSIGLGLLLNTRGLTELVVLDVGHKAGVIDDRLFTVLILVAILATAMTMPLLPRALQIQGRAETRSSTRTRPASQAQRTRLPAR